MYRIKPSTIRLIKEKHPQSSRTQLAALLGVSEGTLQNLEGATRQPHLNTVMRAAELSGLTVENIVIKTADL